MLKFIPAVTEVVCTAFDLNKLCSSAVRVSVPAIVKAVANQP